jgi:hypothetical protein
MFTRLALAGSLKALPAQAAVYLTLASQNGLGHKVKMLFSDPFSTVTYRWNWFDAAVLLPYFAVMIILAMYGVHRYTMCYL